MREIMTPSQVAEYLQLNKDTIYRLIRTRKLAAVRIGRAYRVPKENLTQFILAHSTAIEVRETLFRQVAQIATKNQGITAEQVLKDLQEMEGSLAGASPND